MSSLSKPDARKLARERLRGLSAGELAEKSARICAHIAALPVWRDARVVAFFAAQKTMEPSLEALWESQSGASIAYSAANEPEIPPQKKTICYPRINGTELDLIAVENPDALQASRWQLREPMHDEARIIAPARLDVIFVPGLAFSSDGARLGRGGGYYDRLLAKPELLRAKKIGVCFDAQIFPDLPREPHDIAMDAVITERGAASAH